MFPHPITPDDVSPPLSDGLPGAPRTIDYMYADVGLRMPPGQLRAFWYQVFYPERSLARAIKERAEEHQQIPDRLPPLFPENEFGKRLAPEILDTLEEIPRQIIPRPPKRRNVHALVSDEEAVIPAPELNAIGWVKEIAQNWVDYGERYVRDVLQRRGMEFLEIERWLKIAKQFQQSASASTGIEEHRAVQLMRLEEIYVKAMGAGDFKSAITALKNAAVISGVLGAEQLGGVAELAEISRILTVQKNLAAGGSVTIGIKVQGPRSPATVAGDEEMTLPPETKMNAPEISRAIEMMARPVPDYVQVNGADDEEET